MGLEFTGTCHDVDILENLCINLSKCGVAQKVKDSSHYERQTEGFIEGDIDAKYIQNKFSTKVYNNYLINIKDRRSIIPYVVKIRFWKDKRLNKAGIKITEDGLLVIMQSMTVVSLLQKMNIKLGGGSDGKIDLDKIAELLTKALSEKGASAPFAVSKVD